MDPRQRKAVEIANRFRITEKAGKWFVPSQTGAGRYSVALNGTPRCSCPDFDIRGVKCKHILAVEYVVEEQRDRDGASVFRESVRVTETVQRTYSQDWPSYNAAQTSEKDRFQDLLAALCRGLPADTERKQGRPPIPLADSVFSAVLKVYTTLSARRFMSDLRTAHSLGHIGHLPHYNSVLGAIEKPELTPVLNELIKESSLPLAAIETEFAVDSSGFSTCRFERWFDERWGKGRGASRREWLKAHLMIGVRTNIVTAVQITDKWVNDTHLLPGLLATTAANFPVKELSADKGYLSQRNVTAICEAGATPFIAPKINTKATINRVPEWNKMVHYFNYRRDDFLQHYHRRSNVETAFHMLKSKFGDSLRSKTDTALRNELLCKVLAHNLVVLVHEIFELGIEPVFWADLAGAQKISR